MPSKAIKAHPLEAAKARFRPPDQAPLGRDKASAPSLIAGRKDLGAEAMFRRTLDRIDRPDEGSNFAHGMGSLCDQLEGACYVLFEIGTDTAGKGDARNLAVIASSAEQAMIDAALVNRIDDIGAIAEQPMSSLRPWIYGNRSKKWEALSEIHCAPGRTHMLGLFSQTSGSSLHGIVVDGVATDRDCEKLAQFHLLGSALLEQLSKTRKDETPTNLTRMEKNCLQWCANGKTSYEISVIVGLSEHTVNHYISAAVTKLGASNRVHAIAKALKTGLLRLSDVA